MRYVPALDGLRALAVLAVLLHHASVPGFGGGGIGVDVFFVLSGYLITRVLAEKPDLRRFYRRRITRLVPAFTLMLATYLIVAPIVWPGILRIHIRDALTAFLYLSDYTKGFWLRPAFLGHTWSLSVEEHFYLLWPLIFLRFKPSVTALALGYELLTMWRWAQGDYSHAMFRFDAHCAGLLLGCIVAQLPRTRIEPAWPGLLVLGLAVVFMPLVDGYNWRLTGVTLVEVAAAVAIVGRHPKWLSAAPLTYIGKLSYGIYLWHFPIVQALKTFDWGWQAIATTTIVLSVALAALSYHSVEAYFLQKRRPGREPAPVLN